MMTTLESLNPKPWCRIAALALIAIGLTVATLTTALASQRYALLVGVGSYAELRQLKGPPNDVQAMQAALKKWGFDQITVLSDTKATRAAILKALDALVKEAKPGSHVLFYFSGHGTSPHDPNLHVLHPDLALPHTTGALLLYDARKSGDAQTIRQSLLIGREDLRPRFAKLDRNGVHLTAWIDACFSENSTRTLDGLTPRADESISGYTLGSFGSGSSGYEPYPYQHVITFAASAANQTATDIDQESIDKFSTTDGRYHGAFSDALLRALNDRRLPGYGALDKNGDSVVSVDEFATGVSSFMASRAYGHQPKVQPQNMEDDNKIRNQPLFLADQRPQATTPTLVPAQPEKPAPPVAPTRTEPQRREALLDRIVSTAQHTGRATVELEINNPYATNRLPIGKPEHCVKVDLVYKADANGYPLIIDRFSDGTVQWLYPLASKSARQQQRQWQQPVPAGQAKTLWAAQTTPPAGVDTVYTLLLNQPLSPDVVTGTYTISPTDGARFDLLLDTLSQPGRVLGGHRLTLEIDQPQPGELESWPKETCR